MDKDIKQLMIYFFKLKGWEVSDKDSKILFSKYVRPAEKLIQLGNGDFYNVKYKLNNLKWWAESRNLDWTLETLIKKWFEADDLRTKEKHKKVYYLGDPVIEKNGKKYVIVKGDWLEFAGKKEDLITKYE